MGNNEIEVASSQLEVIKSMEAFVEQNLSTLLKPVDDSWQPSDFLPDLTRNTCVVSRIDTRNLQNG